MTVTNGKRKAIRLVEITGPAGDVELPNGRVVAVQPAPSFVVQLSRDLRDLYITNGTEEEHHFSDLCRAMEVLLPDATAEELASLTVPMMTGVVAISMGHVAAVEAVLEQGRSQMQAANPAPTKSRSRRTTKSSTRSRG